MTDKCDCNPCRCAPDCRCGTAQAACECGPNCACTDCNCKAADAVVA